jgi:hypothetical protein
MRLCIDCVHHILSGVCNKLISPVDGRPMEHSAQVLREDMNRCGPEGRWFQAKPLPEPGTTENRPLVR